jgi:hypothetical protein
VTDKSGVIELMKKKLFLLICCFSLFGLIACGSKLNAENLNKVKNGMSQVEVKSILGKPDGVETSEILGLKNVSYLYQNGSNKVNINFINDTVISKHGSFN